MADESEPEMTVDEAIHTIEKLGCGKDDILIIRTHHGITQDQIHSLAQALSELKATHRPELAALIVPCEIEVDRMTKADAEQLKTALADIEERLK
jgi:hypothetical protein